MAIDHAVRRVLGAVLLATLCLAAAADAEQKVAFNVESRKYHCLTCRHAIACTKNCIEISLSEAKRRGGVPCKVCGGSCSSQLSTVGDPAPNQSFERTRSAAASGFAGQQHWRAAQLRIR